MAYKVDTQHTCQYGGCGKNGRYEVFNTYNSSMGHYCGAHADRKVAYYINKSEQITAESEAKNNA